VIAERRSMRWAKASLKSNPTITDISTIWNVPGAGEFIIYSQEWGRTGV